MQRQYIAALCTLLLAEAALAHNVWIRPSSTQLSGDKDYVTIDGTPTIPAVKKLKKKT